MHRHLSRRRALLTVGAGLLGAASQSPSVAAGAALPEALRRGFNLPDQAPLRAGRDAHRETLRALRALGMTHVRLPVVAENVLAAIPVPPRSPARWTT